VAGFGVEKKESGVGCEGVGVVGRYLEDRKRTFPRR
jgi:hypothetical protein